MLNNSILSTPIFIICLSLLVIATTLIPMIRDDFWIFRVFEYPRLQKLAFNVLLILVFLIFYTPTSVSEWLLCGALLLNLGYLCYQVWPFTVFGSKQIINSKRTVGDNNLRMLIANVYQENRQASDYHRIIEKCNPDVLLLVETNQWWQEQMAPINEAYPYQLKIPLENTYGMLLYSRLRLENGSINFLVEDDVPSIETEVILKSGQYVKLFCLHPEPPVPQENPRSTERDKEILLVAQKSKDCKLPVIVMGDLNDVAWSYTTELFTKISGLLDPRRGRGFFNSFNAKYFFLRFPLDHIFCSADFTLSSIKRMESCGSDHFPMCADLQYDPVSEKHNNVLEADEADKELAQEKINAIT